MWTKARTPRVPAAIWLLAYVALTATACRTPEHPATRSVTILVRDVQALGAVGDGAHDDTAAIQAALDSGQGRPIDVRFPPGTYKVCARGPGLHALYLRYSNTHIIGSGPAKTVIRFFASGCRDPVTSWDTYQGGVWRGSAFYVDPADGKALQHLEWAGLRITGQTPRSNSSFASLGAMAPFPPRPSDGDGWGGYHSAIFFRAGLSFDDVWIHGCEIDSWRAESILYQGAAYSFTNGRIDHNLIHDSLGSMVSISGSLVIADNELAAGAHGIEIYHYQGNVTVERNYIHDNVKGIGGGGNVPFAGPYGRFLVRDNLFERNHLGSIGFYGHGENYEISDNRFVDGAQRVETYEIHFGELYGGTPKHIAIRRNEFYADGWYPFAAIQLSGTLQDVRVEGNRCGRSSVAEALGYHVAHGVRHALTLGATVRIVGNDFSECSFAINDNDIKYVGQLPYWDANVYGRAGFPHANQHLNGSLKPYWPVVNIVGGSDGSEKTVSEIETAGIPDSLVVKLVAAGDSRTGPVVLPAEGRGFRMKAPHILRVGGKDGAPSWVTIRFDAASRTWNEVEVGS